VLVPGPARGVQGKVILTPGFDLWGKEADHNPQNVVSLSFRLLNVSFNESQRLTGSWI
jgi:hypothetical protein